MESPVSEKRKESCTLTTCAGPLRLRSGRSCGPRADHRQDDASEGSPTRISSPESERRGGGGPNYANMGRGSGARVTAPAGLRGKAPTGGKRRRRDWLRFAPLHARGRAGESPGPPGGGRRCQPRRRPPRAARRGSSWTLEHGASWAQRAGRRLGAPRERVSRALFACCSSRRRRLSGGQMGDGTPRRRGGLTRPIREAR